MCENPSYIRIGDKIIDLVSFRLDIISVGVRGVVLIFAADYHIVNNVISGPGFIPSLVLRFLSRDCP